MPLAIKVRKWAKDISHENVYYTIGPLGSQKENFSQECFLQAKTWYKGNTVVET